MSKATEINEAYLNRHCVMPNGKTGELGDKVEKEVIGDDNFEALAHAGVLVTSQPKPAKKSGTNEAKK